MSSLKNLLFQLLDHLPFPQIFSAEDFARILPYSQGIVLAFPPSASGVSKFSTDLVWSWLSTLALTWSPSTQVVTREGRGEKQHIWDSGSPLQAASVYEGHCPEKESSCLCCELGSLGREDAAAPCIRPPPLVGLESNVTTLSAALHLDSWFGAQLSAHHPSLPLTLSGPF